MLFLRAFFILSFCFFQKSLEAQNTLNITLINHSQYKFVFERAGVEFPVNTLDIDKKTLLPGDTGIIHGTTTERADLSGILYFNGDAQFWVLDKRQFHFGQPIFSMKANYTASKVLSRTFNPIIGPKFLAFVAATVLIFNKEESQEPMF